MNELVGEPETLIADSTLLSVLYPRQVAQSAGFEGAQWARWGSFAVYGMKLHLLCSINRVPLSYELTAANVADVLLVRELLAGAGFGEGGVARRLLARDKGRDIMNENPSKPLLGVDVGTSGSMGVLARTDDEVVATSDQPHEPSLPHGGRTEHESEEVWWKDFIAIFGELPEEADGPIAAVSQRRRSVLFGHWRDRETTWTSMADTVEPNPANQDPPRALRRLQRSLLCHPLYNPPSDQPPDEVRRSSGGGGQVGRCVSAVAGARAPHGGTGESILPRVKYGSEKEE